MFKKRKSSKATKNQNEIQMGKETADTTLHGYPMTGPFTPDPKGVWYCDHKKCQYTQHGVYRRYQIENWRSTKFGKKFTLCDGCVRQYRKPDPKAMAKSSSPGPDVNVKLNLNGGLQPQQPQIIQQPYAPGMMYVPYGGAAPPAYGMAQPPPPQGPPPAAGYGYPGGQMMQQQPMQMAPYQVGSNGAYVMNGQPQPQQQQPQQQYQMAQPVQQSGDSQSESDTEPIVINGVVKQGWMMKKGDIVKSWKKRYFVLKQNKTLNYYESDNAVMVKGTCLLDDVKSVKKKSGQSFEVETSKRTWCFACKDKIARDVWVKKIKAVAGI